MESDIIMLSGHGNSGGIYFNSEGQGGEYDFWVTSNLAAENSIIVQNYNMANVKLFIFDGCETAREASNVAKIVVDRGAKAAIGWTVEIGVDCMYEWKNKFNNCIALGYTIQAAINYANSFNYGDNTCKNYRLYGNGAQVLKRSSASATSEIQMEKAVARKSGTKISRDNLDNKDLIRQAILAVYPKFSFNDFELDIALDGDKATVTVVEKIGEFRTQNAYVLFYENGKITEIYDRIQVKSADAKFTTGMKEVRELEKQTALSLAAQKINQEVYTITGQEGKAFYDLATGEKYYMVYTTIATEDGAKSVLSYKYSL